MKINWKIRFKNRVFVVSFTTLIVGFVYQVLGLFDIVPKVNQDNVLQIIMLVVNVLSGLGIVVDSTTKGIGDSDRALRRKDFEK